MKKIIRIAIVVLTIGSFSCKDYLDTPLTTNSVVENYYSTPGQAEVGLVGCYDGLQRIWDGGVAFPVASTVMADMTFGGTGAADPDNYKMMDEFDKNVAPAFMNMFEDNWKAYYAGIFRCNTLLMRMAEQDWTKDNARATEVQAEARFLRAYMYFDLVRMFGNIPLLTQPTKANIPQVNPDEVYKLITEDLLFAIENTSDTPYPGIAATDYGHANKWASEALLARVYLFYTGYYGASDLVGLVKSSDALGYLEDLITNSGHGLIDDYSSLWPAAATYEAAMRGDSISANTYAGETNKEIVFAIKYTYTSDYNGNADGNSWMVMNGLRNQSWGKYGYGNGWGACPVMPSVYVNWNANDIRRESSIMAIVEEGIDYQQINDVKEYTGYFTKKYTPTADKDGNSITVTDYGAVNFMIGQFQDYFSIRYADVLLMAAELGSANALNYVNMVRNRAGVTPVASVDKDVIFEERRLELAFEGHRYWDLLRYDNTLDYAVNKIAFSGRVMTAGAEVDKVIDAANIKLTRGLCQIPFNQITLSDGVLVQNAGW